MCLHGIHSWYPLISAWQYRYIHTVNSSILHDIKHSMHTGDTPTILELWQHYPLTILAACIPFNYWQKNPVQYFSKEYRISINKELRVMVKLYVSLDHYLYTLASLFFHQQSHKAIILVQRLSFAQRQCSPQWDYIPPIFLSAYIWVKW